MPNCWQEGSHLGLKAPKSCRFLFCDFQIGFLGNRNVCCCCVNTRDVYIQKMTQILNLVRLVTLVCTKMLSIDCRELMGYCDIYILCRIAGVFENTFWSACLLDRLPNSACLHQSSVLIENLSICNSYRNMNSYTKQHPTI